MKPLSSEFLLSQGSCCGNRCRNCPYDPRWQKGNVKSKLKTKTDKDQANGKKN